MFSDRKLGIHQPLSHVAVTSVPAMRSARAGIRMHAAGSCLRHVGLAAIAMQDRYRMALHPPARPPFPPPSELPGM